MGEIQTFNDSVGAVELTDSLVEEYLEDLSSRGRNVYTVKKYRNCLRELRVFLLREDRPLTIEAVELWRDSLEEDGFFYQFSKRKNVCGKRIVRVPWNFENGVTP